MTALIPHILLHPSDYSTSIFYHLESFETRYDIVFAPILDDGTPHYTIPSLDVQY